jgi:heme/copper-type cytochrome/quinol oxidase subunit 2
MPRSVIRDVKSVVLRTALAVAAVVLVAGVAQACPTCSEGMADAQHQAMATGYFYSILFMMSMPFAILGTFGSLAYFSIRRARERRSLENGQSIDG